MTNPLNELDKFLYEEAEDQREQFEINNDSGHLFAASVYEAAVSTHRDLVPHMPETAQELFEAFDKIIAYHDHVGRSVDGLLFAERKAHLDIANTAQNRKRNLVDLYEVARNR